MIFKLVILCLPSRGAPWRKTPKATPRSFYPKLRHHVRAVLTFRVHAVKNVEQPPNSGVFGGRHLRLDPLSVESIFDNVIFCRFTIFKNINSLTKSFSFWGLPRSLPGLWPIDPVSIEIWRINRISLCIPERVDVARMLTAIHWDRTNAVTKSWSISFIAGDDDRIQNVYHAFKRWRMASS